jgi:kynurenine 3-monooxygenase
LIGDAAHAIVPFFGQGVNCGFEDVFVLKQLLASGKSLSEAIERFGVERKIDSDAIADLALENFDEMRSKVADSKFLFRKKLDGFIMNALPTKYRTRYTLVMYSENPYSVCKTFGEFLNEFLSIVIEKFNLCESSDLSADIDLETLESLVDNHVTPKASELGVSFDF